MTIFVLETDPPPERVQKIQGRVPSHSDAENSLCHLNFCGEAEKLFFASLLKLKLGLLTARKRKFFFQLGLSRWS